MLNDGYTLFSKRKKEFFFPKRKKTSRGGGGGPGGVSQRGCNGRMLGFKIRWMDGWNVLLL
jgi:hypothetical protein